MQCQISWLKIWRRQIIQSLIVKWSKMAQNCKNKSLTVSIRSTYLPKKVYMNSKFKSRVVKWAENQIVLVAKLRPHFQNQIAIAKSCEELWFSHFELQNYSKTWIFQWVDLMKIILRFQKEYLSFKNVSTTLYGQYIF